MFNLQIIFLFIFVFSILSIIRLVFKFVSALLRNPPERLILSSRELIFYGILISYFITYIIK